MLGIEKERFIRSRNRNRIRVSILVNSKQEYDYLKSLDFKGKVYAEISKTWVYYYYRVR